MDYKKFEENYKVNAKYEMWDEISVSEDDKGRLIEEYIQGIDDTFSGYLKYEICDRNSYETLAEFDNLEDLGKGIESVLNYLDYKNEWILNNEFDIDYGDESTDEQCPSYEEWLYNEADYREISGDVVIKLHEDTDCEIYYLYSPLYKSNGEEIRRYPKGESIRGYEDKVYLIRESDFDKYQAILNSQSPTLVYEPSPEKNSVENNSNSTVYEAEI
jgi:hypothetical protein